MNKPAAGWFPDPSGQPGQRYHDGQRWTEHFASPPLPYPYPAQPIVPGGCYQPYPPQPVAVAVSTGGGVNHALHAVLTFFTCGMWLPVWIIIAIFGNSSRSSVAVAGHGVSVNTGPNRKPLIVAGVVLGWFLLGASVMHPWLLAILIPIVGLAGLIFWMRKDDEKRKRLAAHADYEDRLYYEGDPRGTYGRHMPPESLREEDGR
jgi:Protein of unknown function (DUF2510)